MGRATQPIDALMNAWKSLLEAKKSYLTLESALEAHPQREACSVVGETPGAEIVFEEVRATAEQRAAPILEGISFSLPSGKALGIIGPSGSGKSTLVRVMLGIWPNVEGRVLYEGVSIREQDRVALGTELGYLPQDVELFNGSIADNVARFGEVDPEKVIAACQQAGVHEMILRFPKGYDTVIGEDGYFLSGGQSQRIGLARALYGSPRLVALDEPNANLDDAGDRALFQAVLKLKQQGVTVVLITHRMQVMAAMDFALVLEGGKIKYFGKPQLPGEKPGSGLAPMSAPVPMPA
jgi:ATP-binding cassette subfamily C exporter for protease/lipase